MVEKDLFYCQLQQTIDNTEDNTKIMINGDWSNK